MYNSNNTKIFSVLVILVLITLGFLTYLFLNNNSQINRETSTSISDLNVKSTQNDTQKETNLEINEIDNVLDELDKIDSSMPSINNSDFE